MFLKRTVATEGSLPAPLSSSLLSVALSVYMRREKGVEKVTEGERVGWCSHVKCSHLYFKTSNAENTRHVRFPCQPEKVPYGLASLLGLGLSGFSLWHFLELDMRASPDTLVSSRPSSSLRLKEIEDERSRSSPFVSMKS